MNSATTPQNNMRVADNMMTTCPCCESQEFELLEDFHLVCKCCGLVVAATDNYVANIKIKLDFGLLL